MAVKKTNGHAVTTIIPSNSDAASVASVNVPFVQAPATQSGGKGGPKLVKGAK